MDSGPGNIFHHSNTRTPTISDNIPADFYSIPGKRTPADKREPKQDNSSLPSDAIAGSLLRASGKNNQ